MESLTSRGIRVAPRRLRSAGGGLCRTSVAALAAAAWLSGATALPADTVLQTILALPPETPAAADLTGCKAFGGEWRVLEDGVLSVEAGDGPKLLCTAEEVSRLARGAVSVDIRLPAGEKNRQGYRNAGILLKVSEAGEGADAFNGYEIAPSPEGHVNIGLHRQDYAGLKRIPCRIPANQWFTLKVTFDETAFDIFIDGARVGGFEDGALRAGAVALRAWQCPVMYRNWTVNGFAVPFSKPPAPAPAVYPPDLATGNLPPVLFVARHPLTQPNAVGNDIWQGRPTAPGCALRLMRPAQPERPVETLFESAAGSIYDLSLSADAKTAYFSHRRSLDEKWHLWALDIASGAARQLTDGDDFDISPCEAPDGSLIFVSTRRFGYTVCQPGPASNLFRLLNFRGGGEPVIACISMNTLSDFSPAMLPDGRVLFTRWEYIDRDLTFRQSLWTEYPDGTNYRLFFGNTIRDVGTFWQAKPLPGRNNQLVATFAPHHGYPHGMIGLIDRDAGIEGGKGKGFCYITKEVPSVGDRNQPWGYRDPFPLSDDQFLCSCGGGPRVFQNDTKRFAIFLLNRRGGKRLLYEDETMSCVCPVPVREREPEAVIADRVKPVSVDDLDEKPLTGTLLLTDINEGLQGKVERGVIVALRVMEQMRKTEDLVRRAYDQSPVMSYGTYYAKRDWGTVPLEEDGSACFTVPALREIYLQGLDTQGREVFRMTSALQVMPGERLSCFGCHENRDAAPARSPRLPLAAAKKPVAPRHPGWLMNRSRLNPQPDAAVFDYPTTVQPVLDRHCVSCHNGGKAEGGYDLTGGKTRFFSISYDNLLGTSRSYRQHDLETGQMLPGEAAKGKPLVHFFWLLKTPTAVNEPYITGSHASRLTDIIESGHHDVKMSLEDRQVIYYWMDANVPYYGTYAHSRPNAAGRRDRFADPASEKGAYAPWYKRFLAVYQRRCAECHQSFEQPSHTDWTGRYAWINLSEPERSAALTAHLPEASGGRGIAAVKGGGRQKAQSEAQLIFQDTGDADYAGLLNDIREGRRAMLEHPEADMPGFAPRWGNRACERR